MDIKERLLIAALCVLGAIGAYLRPFPMGFDAYFWMTPGLAHASGLYPPFFSVIAPFLFAVPWLTTIAVCALIAGITYHTAREASIQHPALASALLFAAPQFLFRIAEIEDDLVGVPLCLLSLLFYLRWKRDETKLHNLAIAGFAGMFAFLFWRGAVIYALALAINEARRFGKPAMLVPAAALFYIIFPWFGGLSGESAFGVYWFVFGLGIVAYALHSWKIRPADDNLFWLAVVFASVALMRASYLWLFVPIAAVVLVNDLGGWLLNDRIGSAVLGFAVVFGLLFGNVGVIAEHPTPGEIADVKDVANITAGAPIANDWQYGHWLRWAGANPLFSNLHPQPKLTIPEEAEYVLSEESLTLELVKNYSSFALYRAPR